MGIPKNQLSGRAGRRRAAKENAGALVQPPTPATAQAVEQMVSVTMADIQAVMDASPDFRQMVVSTALARELSESRERIRELEAAGTQEPVKASLPRNIARC